MCVQHNNVCSTQSQVYNTVSSVAVAKKESIAVKSQDKKKASLSRVEINS